MRGRNATAQENITKPPYSDIIVNHLHHEQNPSEELHQFVIGARNIEAGRSCNLSRDTHHRPLARYQESRPRDTASPQVVDRK
jgi:hypothetical protein